VRLDPAFQLSVVEATRECAPWGGAGDCAGPSISKEAQALESAAFLVAALAEGAKILSDEVKDAVQILHGELDGLGLLEQYRRDGKLIPWDQDEIDG
jgi:hypothetical protein